MKSEEFLLRDEESEFTSPIGKVLGSVISIIEKEISRLSGSGLKKFFKQNLKYTFKENIIQAIKSVVHYILETGMFTSFWNMEIFVILDCIENLGWIYTRKETHPCCWK